MRHVLGCLTRVRTRLFSTSLPRYNAIYSDEPIGEHQQNSPPENKIRHIAEMLDLPESYVASKTIFKHARVEEKIRYLLSSGCTQRQLRSSRFTYLKLSAKKLEELTRPTAETDGKPNVQSILGDDFELYPSRNKDDRREEIATLLNVSEDELTSRHFKQIKAKTLVPKIKILLSFGVQPSEIFQAPYVLRHSTKNLQQACEKLTQQGVDKLRISDISIETHKKPKPSTETISKLSELLGIPVKKLELYVSEITCSPKALVPKVEFLIKEGFESKDIIEYLGKLSVFNFAKFAEAVTDLQSIKGKNFEIQDVLHYASSQSRGKLKVREQHTTARRLAQLLNIPCGKLKMKFFPWGSQQTTMELKEKIELLETNGFTIDVIRKCPIILLHDSHILEFCLKSLASIPELQPYEDWKNDQDKLIQALEYIVERGLKGHVL